MGSRLFIKLRDKTGLAYIVDTDLSYYKDLGIYTIYFGTYPNKINKAYNIVINELTDLKKNLVTKSELKKAIDYSVGSQKLSAEDTNFIAENNFSEYYYSNKIVPWKSFFNKIKNVKPIDVKNVANDIFNIEKINVTIVNNKKINNLIKSF